MFGADESQILRFDTYAKMAGSASKLFALDGEKAVDREDALSKMSDKIKADHLAEQCILIFTTGDSAELKDLV